MKVIYFIIIFLIEVCLWGCFSKEPIKTGLEGKPLPSFSLLLKDSITYFNSSDIPSGQPIVLYYFSPYCPHCRSQTETIIEDMKRLKNIRFYMFSSHSISELKRFNSQYQIDKYPNIVIGLDYKSFFAQYFNTRSVPLLAIYESDKKLKEVFLGKVSTKQIAEIAFNF